jgi:hypothetical protein
MAKHETHMKKILAALIAASALTLGTAGVAQAAPAMCNGHSNHDGWAFGPDGSKYITACGGDSGPDAQNNAQIPHVVEAGGITDADGTQGEWSNSVHADVVRDSPVFAPG